MKTIIRLLKANKAILLNTGSLLGTWGITSGLGFVYWWLAAREFVPQEVGIGSAAIAVMTLLGTICLIGLGTLLITELPRHPEQAGPLISTALVAVGIVGAVVGLLFAWIMPAFSANFAALRANINTPIVFALGVSLTAITSVLDQALIGLLKGGLQLSRNGIFALGKLIILFLIWQRFASTGGIGIYAAWAAGNFLSLLPLLWLVLRKKGLFNKDLLPQWSLLRKLGLAALQHHLLNLVLSAPILLLPVIVTVLLSVQASAWFYIAWMVANFVFIVPGALTMVLHAVNSAQQASLRQRARITLSLALAISSVAIVVLWLSAPEALTLFGSAYAQQASWTLRILTLASLPASIKNHYVSICRIYDRILQALVSIAIGCILELAGATIGAHLAGLAGLSLGWTLGYAIEAVYMYPVIHRAVFGKRLLKTQGEESPEPNWIMDTALLPALGRGYTGTESVWLINTALQPAIGRLSPETKPLWLVETTRLPAVKPPTVQRTIHRTIRKNRLEPARSSSAAPRSRQELAADTWLASKLAEEKHDNSTIFENETH